MHISLIICTYMRPQAVLSLLQSVEIQNVLPAEVLIIDGSTDQATEQVLQGKNWRFPLHYFAVPAEHRGLTRQRNYGIGRVADHCNIVAFLDDDIVLEQGYFQALLNTYIAYPAAVGVGGYIWNEAQEVHWRKLAQNEQPKPHEYVYDGWARRKDLRHRLRDSLGLGSNKPPCFMPEFSHGLSVGYLPPSGNTYPAQFFFGGVSSFRKDLFNQLSFSQYFIGYGLYEDLDFTFRASRTGPLYVNTAALVNHYHAPGGRPNLFRYGKMVTRNGWYVWRVAYPKPSLKAKIKWHLITVLLAFVRITPLFSLNTRNYKSSLEEFAGRISAWIALIFKTPRHA
jgi:GT2 family glycosyltransferase